MEGVLQRRVSLGWRRGLFWRKGGDDLRKARVATQRVPKREQLKHAVARDIGCTWCRRCRRQLLQGQILFASPRLDHSNVRHQSLPSKRIFLHRQQLHCAATFLQSSFLVAKSCIDQTQNTKRRPVILLLLHYLLLRRPC